MQARQIIQHGHVLVGGRIVNVSSFRVREGMEIEVREIFKTNAMLEDSIKLAKALSSVPEWIDVDFENRKSKILRLPTRQDIAAPFNEQLVIELYSK
jgi:small subunit ribosomal protein S4